MRRVGLVLIGLLLLGWPVRAQTDLTTLLSNFLVNLRANKIQTGATVVLHSYTGPSTNGVNLFVGPNAGNFTMSQVGGNCVSGVVCASYNTGVGNGGVLTLLSTGLSDTCVGSRTCAAATIANELAGFGTDVLNACVGCLAETGVGASVLSTDIDGAANVGVGDGALTGLLHGLRNVAIGVAAGYTGVSGANACVSAACTDNTWVGNNTGASTATQLTDSIALGSGAQNSASHQMVFGTATTTTNKIFGTPQTAVLMTGTPLTPAGTTSATGVVMGLNQTITVVTTGRLDLSVTGDISNTVGVGDTPIAQLAYGTGTPPVNGAAPTGTLCGTQAVASKLTAGAAVPFMVRCLVTGLTAGTAYWIDLDVTSAVGGTSTVTSVIVAAREF